MYDIENKAFSSTYLQDTQSELKAGGLDKNVAVFLLKTLWTTFSHPEYGRIRHDFFSSAQYEVDPSNLNQRFVHLFHTLGYKKKLIPLHTNSSTFLISTRLLQHIFRR